MCEESVCVCLSVSISNSHANTHTHTFSLSFSTPQHADMVNNVAIVGHSHPAVSAAAAKQMSRLNTNR